MGGAVKAEFRKFFTTRLWWGMAIGVFLSGALFALIFAVWGPGSSQQGANGASGAGCDRGLNGSGRAGLGADVERGYGV